MKKIISILSILLLTIGCASCSFTDEDFVSLFEEYTDLTFPPSGKVTLNDNPDAWKYMEHNYVVIFEVDTLDYNEILHQVQTRSNSFAAGDEDTTDITYSRLVVDNGIDAYDTSEYAYYEEHRDSNGRRFWLSFDEDKRTIKCNLESI